MELLKLLFFSLCLWTIETSHFASPPKFEDNILRIRVYSSCDMSLPIGIGTPVQWLNLSLDFITPDTVLYMEKMDYEQESESDPPVYNRKIFQTSESSTFHNYSKSFIDELYGNGYLAADLANLPIAGHYGQQRAITKNKLDFMPLTKIGWIMKLGAKGVPSDGELGLAPLVNNKYGIGSFMEWMKGNKTSAMITFYFNNFNAYDPDLKRRNSYAIVSLDEELPLSSKCLGAKWFHTPSLAIPNMWSLVAKSIVIGSGKGKKGKSATIILALNQTVMVQPTQFMTSMPRAQMNILKKAVGAAEPDAFGNYMLPCNSSKFAPTLKFIFADSVAKELMIEFTPKEYICLHCRPSGDCQLIFTHDTLEKSTIYTIGYTFFQRYCLQLKYTSNIASVGLTSKKI